MTADREITIETITEAAIIETETKSRKGKTTKLASTKITGPATEITRAAARAQTGTE